MRKIALAAGLFLAAASTALAATADTKRMVLGLSDLPAGFTVEKGRYVDNRAAARQTTNQSQAKSLADYKRWGRIMGYERNFEREGLVGALQVESNASVYKTAKGATESTRESFSVATKPNVAGWVFKPVSAGGAIGHEARVYSTSVKQGGLDLTVVVVIWRYRTVKASIFAGGFKGTVDAAEIASLARKQQAKIEAAIRG